MNWLFFLVYFITAAGSYIYVFVIFDKIYKPKNLSMVWKAAFVVIMSLMRAAFLYINVSIFKFMFAITAIVLLNIIFYKPPGKVFLLYDMLYLIITSIVEILSSFLIGIILKVSKDDIITKPLLFLAAMIFTWIIMIAFAKSFILIVAGKGVNNIRTHEFIMFLILIAGEIFMLQFFSNYITKSPQHYKIIIVLITFLALDLYLAYLLKMIAKTYQTEKELQLVTQQSMLQLNAYKELNEKYTASRRIIHDVRKHIASLEGLINDNRADEAIRYRSLLNAELDKLIPRFECDSPILTVVINNKLEAAEKMNVDFKVDAEFTQIDFISNLDITAIFSNMLDNAFEACEELPEDKRRVWLSITRRNHFVFVFLENSFSEVATDIEKGYRSTKKGHQGIGLSNIRNVCEKYHGSFNAHTENETFITELLIPIPDKDTEKAEISAEKQSVKAG